MISVDASLASSWWWKTLQISVSEFLVLNSLQSRFEVIDSLTWHFNNNNSSSNIVIKEAMTSQNAILEEAVIDEVKLILDLTFLKVFALVLAALNMVLLLKFQQKMEKMLWIESTRAHEVSAACSFYLDHFDTMFFQ